MTIDNTTIARPYAKAAFQNAVAQQTLARWSEMLNVAAQVCLDKRVANLLENPLISDVSINKLFLSVCDKCIDEPGRNFLSLLAENKRLAILPEIQVIYEALRAEHERVVDVSVTSYMVLSDAQKQQLAQSMQQRLQREVALTYSIDDGLLGGAVVRAGDLVIDGSVRGKLSRLAEEIAA